jgi:outer membrane lipoprotein-sorting protein
MRPLPKLPPVPLLALLALAAGGCPRGGRLSPDLAADPAALLADVRARQEEVRSVRGTAKLRVDSPSLRGTVTEFIAAEKPARLHLETLDFFGNPAAVLVADGDRFGFYDARTRTFYRGDATPENVSRFLPVVIPPAELVTILCGSAPILPGEALEASPRDGRILLVVGLGAIGQQLTVGDRLAIERSRVRRASEDPAAQAAFYDLDFDDFRRRGGIRFPGEARLDAAGARSSVRLAWRSDLEVNARLDADLFRIEPPRGAAVVELPPGAAPPPSAIPLEPAE